MKLFRRMSLPLKTQMLGAACARLGRATGERTPRRQDVALLALAWGNLGYAAGLSYLQHVGARARRTQGPILECGSGVTTLLIGALTVDRGVEFVVLEHDREWYEYLGTILDRLKYRHIRLIHAPLRDFGKFRWYRVPEGRVNRNIGLVVCDGPPGNTPGGRYGLMPVMQEHLAGDCVILLDDTHRKEERRIIDVWRRYRCLEANRFGRFGTHAELVFC